MFSPRRAAPEEKSIKVWILWVKSLKNVKDWHMRHVTWRRSLSLRVSRSRQLTLNPRDGLIVSALFLVWSFMTGVAAKTTVFNLLIIPKQTIDKMRRCSQHQYIITTSKVELQLSMVISPCQGFCCIHQRASAPCTAEYSRKETEVRMSTRQRVELLVGGLCRLCCRKRTCHLSNRTAHLVSPLWQTEVFTGEWVRVCVCASCSKVSSFGQIATLSQAQEYGDTWNVYESVL